MVTETQTDTKREKVAQHDLLDQNGQVVENLTEELAWGTKYTLLANGRSAEYIYGKNADQDRMYAVLGAKTMMTNESSSIRNSPKGEGTPDEQIDAVLERLALNQTGKWVDRTREGAPKVDKDALARAVMAVMVREGKWTAEDIADGGAKSFDVVRKRLDDKPEFLRDSRATPAVATEYATIVGRKTATPDDLNF